MLYSSRRFSRSSLAFLSVAPLLLTSAALAQSQQPTSSNQYPTPVVEDYLEGCQRKAVNAGIPESLVKNFCSCTLNKLQARYTAEEFQQLRDRATTASETPKPFTEVGMACFGELSRLSN